jgi:hypothetical protein
MLCRFEFVGLFFWPASEADRRSSAIGVFAVNQIENKYRIPLCVYRIKQPVIANPIPKDRTQLTA